MNNLIEKKPEGFVSKIKRWFSNLFGNKNGNIYEQNDDGIEFTKENNVVDEEVFENTSSNDKIKYEFSTPTVSKQKIEKIRLDFDNGKIGIDSLYELSNDELQELSKNYDAQIKDAVLKLNEIEVTINNYRRKLSKIQNQE